MRYDITSERDRIRAAFDKLRKTQRPGESAATMGGKKDVINAVESEIAALLRDGYTPRQIADAMRDGDRFSILPKSITEALRASEPVGERSAKKSQRKPKQKPSASANANANVQQRKSISDTKASSNVDASAGKRGAFAVHNDTKDDDL